MPRPFVLDDPVKRQQVLDGVGSGLPLDEISTALGTTRQSVHRYCAKNPAFADQMRRARENAPKAPLRTASPWLGSEHQATLAASVVGAEPKQEPTDASQENGSDWPAAPIVPAEPPKIRAPPGTSYSDEAWLAVCWERFDRDDAQSPRYAKLLQPLALYRAMRELERQENMRIAEHQRAVAAQLSAGEPIEPEVVDERPRPSGMVVLEVPANKARPHLRGSRDVVDVEVEVEPGMAKRATR